MMTASVFCLFWLLLFGWTHTYTLWDAICLFAFCQIAPGWPPNGNVHHLLFFFTFGETKKFGQSFAERINISLISSSNITASLARYNDKSASLCYHCLSSGHLITPERIVSNCLLP